MMSRLAVLLVAAVSICGAASAGAEEVGVGVKVGPVGVTVGSGHERDRVAREREIIRERDRHRGDKTVIIKKDRDRDYDRGRRTTIIERD